WFICSTVAWFSSISFILASRADWRSAISWAVSPSSCLIASWLASSSTEVIEGQAEAILDSTEGETVAAEKNEETSVVAEDLAKNTLDLTEGEVTKQDD
ncbi:unnamed protein product, partial [marine sediment metagenome]